LQLLTLKQINMRHFYFYCLLALLPLIGCKEEEKSNDPIEISSEVYPVSIHGASDGSIMVTVVGGIEPFSYLWSNGATSRDLTEIPAGIYSLTVTDADGETESITDTVAEPSELLLTYTKIDESAPGAADGSITLSVTGGTPPYVFDWSNGEKTSTITDLTAGLYSVTLTDAAQAELHEEIQILAPLTLSITGTDISTYNGANGSIDLLVQGGVEPYTFGWSNGSTTEDLSSLPAGFYKVTVTDANATVKQTKITLYEPYDVISPEADLLQGIDRLVQSGLRINYQGDQIIYIDPVNLYHGLTGDAEIILITHSHGDHYAPSIISQLINDQTTLLVPADIYSDVLSYAGAATVLQIAPDSAKTINGVNIEVVPAYNSNHFLPFSVGYILTLDGLRVYHSGDTQRIPEMTAFNADIAFLPMGQTYTFSSIEEAADAARDVGASVVVPIHYGIYEGSFQDPWTFKNTVEGEMDVCVKPSIEE
jgi:L-ascorbate metabolism protein UlaG (beta-lactamase superfamily)